MPSSSKKSADIVLILTILSLTLFGVIMIGSASSVLAERFRDDALFYLKHQILYGCTVGLAAFLLGFLVPYRKWRALALPGLLVSLVLLVIVFIPGLNLRVGGAARWIAIGPLTLQPTEITKLAVIIYLAALFERKGEDIRDFRKSVIPFVVILLIITTLIALQPDIGTLLVITATSMSVIFVSGVRLRHIGLLGLGGLAILGTLATTASYRLSRLIVYLHPELDPRGIGYQINQALLAVGTGGIWGLGFGRSIQKYQYLPEPAGDAIFAVIAEELGLLRTSLIVVGYALIGWRGYLIAQKAPDAFGRLMATGITSWIMVQAFINMGAILALTPLTGIPLPFISYGGSSLAALLFGTGILLNISRET